MIWRGDRLCDGFAAITTAGDLKFGVALDAPPEGFVLANPENAKQVMADLVAGKSARLEGEAAWLRRAACRCRSDGEVTLTVSNAVVRRRANGLLYHPERPGLGIGCERGCGGEEALALAQERLRRPACRLLRSASWRSIDVKADEAAVHHVAKHFGCPVRFFDAATLEAETPRLKPTRPTSFSPRSAAMGWPRARRWRRSGRMAN
jgi:cobalt-precorrin 5A hydrolase/precorrin-3B C17-methyltransferase